MVGYIILKSSKVFKNWVSGQDEYFNEDLNNFYQYWNNLTKRSEIIDLPDAVNQELIKLAPDDYSEITIVDDIFCDDEIEDGDDEIEDNFKLREYQEEAIDNWFHAG